MNPQDELKNTVESILAELHAKIDTLKARVEKLCENTDWFEPLDMLPKTKEEKKK